MILSGIRTRSLDIVERPHLGRITIASAELELSTFRPSHIHVAIDAKVGVSSKNRQKRQKMKEKL